MNHEKRAIEEYFPIVEINRLAVPERNAFKPIYQMHKWFARRASCVFRAILLGCLKPAGTDIMEEFYKDHTHDLDTNGKVILDPFMGGGTTVVEALRLGCKVIGIDLNPVAWFIVKTEVEPVDIDELKAAFDRLANHTVAWSGKSVKETLLDQYKTDCPCCAQRQASVKDNHQPLTTNHSAKADIIYTFWVKSAICTNPLCKKEVPLFSDYIVAQKKPSIRYWRDVKCPRDEKTFDWEVEPASLIAEPELMREDPRTSAGELRGNTRWAFAPVEYEGRSKRMSDGSKVWCPWCNESVHPTPPPTRTGNKPAKVERKKVPLTVLLCPHCETVWQWRGELPEAVTCPVCSKGYDPHGGNVTEKGKFVCPACGTKDAIINSIRRLPEDQLLPMKPYAIEGYCARCGGDENGRVGEGENGGAEDADGVGKGEWGEEGLFNGKPLRGEAREKPTLDHDCALSKNNGKFFKRITPADLARYQTACQTWEREKARLPYPKQEIPDGQETHRLLEHHYRYWHQMFNSRQLLCLGTLLKGIGEESKQHSSDSLLSAFYGTLESNNLFTRNRPTRSSPGGTAPAGVFSRHDYQPKVTSCEQNVWGVTSGSNTFRNRRTAVLQAVEYSHDPWDTKWNEGENKVIHQATAERFATPNMTELRSQDARRLYGASVDFIITDPPYAGNVNYAELSDFFYVWLRLLLSGTHGEFKPELTPKADEIIENPTRGRTARDFEDGLTQVLSQCGSAIVRGGLLVFTFHHSEGKAWDSLLRSVCDSGFEIDSVYPIHGESESSMHLMDKEGAISYDLIHVCKKRDPNATIEPRSWAGIRQEIRRRAREEVRAIEAGRYGNDPLAPADINIILIGKCLELYSRHYGAVIDHESNPVELHEALNEIRSMVDALVAKEHPLPSELEDIDAESRVYLLTLCDRKEINSDEVHKTTRGVLEPADLMEAGLMVKGRAKRGRTYEVKQPAERYQELLEKFHAESPSSQASLFEDDMPVTMNRKVKFIDHVHLLMGLAEAGENLLPWLERFRGLTPQIRAACGYLRQRNASFAPAIQTILGLMDPGPLFRGRV